MNLGIIITVGILILPLIIGLFLPRERVFIKNTVLKSKAQAIWDIIAQPENQVNWRPDLKGVTMLSSEKGKEQWTEHLKKGRSLSFQVKTYIEPTRYDIEIINSPFTGYWEGRIIEKDNLTYIEFREVMVVKNPYFRTIAYLFIDLDKTMDLYLKNLKKALNE